uniref:Gypsy retrotransposon integrase-like protein 1 n=1 Tax=Paramormyrops kingsleyae TaxID=1676925 RepID=A0A3B3SGH8_9TELE
MRARRKGPILGTGCKGNRRFSSARYNNVGLPKGLIGAKYTASVFINGQTCSCLLDTGSQVTTVSQSFYEDNLPHLSIHPLDELLEVEAANGQTVPYSGFIEVDITFPKSCFGSEITVSTLALVVPTTGSSARSMPLIGTNTLDLVYEDYCRVNTDLQTLPYGCRVVLKVMQQRNKQKKNSSLGLVRLPGREPRLVPAGESCVVEGLAHVNSQALDRWVVIEPPSSSSMPGGMLVISCLLSLPNNPSKRIPVVLHNESKHDIIIPAKGVIAEAHALQEVVSCKSSPADSEHSSNSPRSSENVKLNFSFGDSPLPAEWKERIERKLCGMPEVFALHDSDFGRTDKVKHQIRLSDETPFKYRPRPIRPQDLDAVRRHLKELSEAGVIRESESPFSSPIVVVRKKNGDVRLCVDYRRLNLQTIKDAYALPNLEEAFSALTGSKWFSVLDLKSGYYQVDVEEADKPKTAFVCPLGFWEFNRMPQGVTNAPSTFQRLMEKCMADINLKEVLVFLDDLIVFSETVEEHEVRFLRVLTRLKEYGLKLSLEKCKFFQTSVRYLGHIVSQYGVETDPEKIEALKAWPSPRNLKELRSFLGFAGYYRRFIRNFSKIVKPLNDLTAGYPPPRKHDKPRESSGKYFKPREPFGKRWTPSCQEAFETIIDKLTTAPVLGFANPKLPYVLHTDASTTGLGAVLYQEQEGVMRVIAYASRGLSKSESRYPAHKLEFLALKWAVTEKFADYLYGVSFTVVTDSNPLTYLLTTAKLDAASYRWLSALSTFKFQLQYRAGKCGLDADGLSRRPHAAPVNDLVSQKEEERIRQFLHYHLPESGEFASISPKTVDAICEKHLVCPPGNISENGAIIPLVTSLAMSAKAIPDSFENCDGFPVIPRVTGEELKQQQRADPAVCEIIHLMETGETPTPAVKKELPDLSIFLREMNKLELKDDILYRKRRTDEGTQHQIVLPETFRDMVMRCLHDDMGHLGFDRTLDLTRSRFFWPRMATDIEKKVKSCSRCVCRKALPEKAAPLVNIHVTRPLELVCMDFLSIEPDRSNTKNVLVITDFFTKYALAIPTPNQKARTVAKCLWENFIVHYGFPEKLHSDQGPDFESRTIKELCDLAGIRKVRTTPYHPRGNPVERFNRTLLSMLGTLKAKDKSRWRDFVKPLVHAYNCTKHETTGFTPYELMFGRQPRLPVDLVFNVPLNNSGQKSHSQYIQALKAHLQESYQVARKNAAKTAKRNKVRYDRRVTESTLGVGDRVLVRNVHLRGRHKLADKWGETVHVVVNRKGDLPVYTVKPENKDGPLRTLHRDLLLPCGFLPVLEDDPPVVLKPRKPSTRQHPKSNHDQNEPEFCSDEDDDFVYSYRSPVFRTMRSIDGYDMSIPPREQTHSSAEYTFSDPAVSSNVPEESGGASSGSSPSLGTRHFVYSEVEPITTIDQPEKENLLEQATRGSDNPVEETESEIVTAGDESLPENQSGESIQRRSESEAVGSSEVMDRSEIEIDDGNCEDEDKNQSTLRRSSRQREPMRRLTYPELGNPLVTIVQTLFQSLSSAITNSLGSEVSLTPLPKPKVI